MTLATRAIEAGQEAAVIRVGGLAFLADRSGALYFAEDRILLVADLHLEKGSAFARRGSMLPPYDSRATLAALADVVTRYDPGCIVAMGDAFHEDGADDRMNGADVEALLGIQKGRNWIWLSGNHDPRGPRRFGGGVLQSLAFGGVTLRHAPQAGAGEAEITGHLHPVGKVSLRGRAVRRRCFVTDGRRCVMPAFGAYAGGLNVLDKAFSTLFDTAALTAHILGQSRIFRVGSPMLRPD